MNHDTWDPWEDDIRQIEKDKSRQKEKKCRDVVWVVYNVNGDTIGVANTRSRAEAIYCEKHGDLAGAHEGSIVEFELNRFYYA